MEIKRRYGRQFGLPAEQIRFFDELNEAQVEQVRQYYSVGLVDVEKYVYAVKRDGTLVWRRKRRDLLMEVNDGVNG